MNAYADPSKTHMAVWLPIVISLMTMVGGGIGWTYSQCKAQETAKAEARFRLHQFNSNLVRDYLQPIKTKLENTRSVHEQLKPYLEPIITNPASQWGILESYIEKAKRDPADDTLPLMNQHIGRLVEADVQIITLLEAYAPYICTDALVADSMAFREHAGTYVSRWATVPKMIRLRSQLPKWKVFPQSFPSSIEREIAARKNDEQCQVK